MDSEELGELLRQPEGLKLDFKREFYKIDHPDKRVREWQWGELIKDILALANGNVGVSRQTAYLVIGVGDKLKPDGTRDLYDVGEIKLTSNDVIQKIDKFCDPPLPDIRCDTVVLEERRIFVVSIPPTPYLHETAQRLWTSDRTVYSEGVVLIRRAEGIFSANAAERRAILAEKQSAGILSAESMPGGVSQPSRKWWISGVFGVGLVVVIAGLTLLIKPQWLGELFPALAISPTVTTTPTATLPPSTPTPAATLIPTLSPTPYYYLVVSIERLRVYAGPGEIYDMWGEVRRGDQLSLQGRSEDGMWWQVDYLGWKGWIRAQAVGASIEPTILPVITPPPPPTITPTPTEEATPTLPAYTEIPLQNPVFDGAYGDSIPGWEHWTFDNWSSGTDSSSSDSYDTPFFNQIRDPARMINGPTLQVEATAFVKFKIYIYQVVSVQSDMVVRFQVLARAYSALDDSGVKLAAGVDPNGGSDCGKAIWGEELVTNESDGVVRLVSPDVAVGDAKRVTVCLYAEPLYPAQSNAAFFDDALLIANPQ